MKRRAAVEPSIGYLKSEHRLERNRLKGTAGNEISAILAAAAMNFQKLLGALWRIFLSCLMDVWNRLLAPKGHKSPQCSTPLRLKITFSGSTNLA